MGNCGITVMVYRQIWLIAAVRCPIIYKACRCYHKVNDVYGSLLVSHDISKDAQHNLCYVIMLLGATYVSTPPRPLFIVRTPNGGKIKITF